jgi:hypothetical protein
MATTTSFTIEGPMTLAYFASEVHAKRILITEEEESLLDNATVGNRQESLESKIAEEIGFPDDQEFDEVFMRMEQLRNQGLRTEDGVPDGTRAINLRITVEVL